MRLIGLQRKAVPQPGTITGYWFENPAIGLARTLFHRLKLPFNPFDSGLDYVPQMEQTSLVVEWIEIGQPDPARLEALTLSSEAMEGMEASIYLGSAHNWTTIHSLVLTPAGPDLYRVEADVLVDFAAEGVGLVEGFRFTTMARYTGIRS